MQSSRRGIDFRFGALPACVPALATAFSESAELVAMIAH